jgi:hypothetical protein
MSDNKIYTQDEWDKMRRSLYERIDNLGLENQELVSKLAGSRDTHQKKAKEIALDAAVKITSMTSHNAVQVNENFIEKCEAIYQWLITDESKQQ